MPKTIFYPKAQKLIETMNLDERIKTTSHLDLGSFFRSSILKSEGQQRLYSIKGEYLGFNEELQNHAEIVNDMLWYPQKYSFEFDDSKLPVDVKDISILMGWEASHILTPAEFINYKDFGADSLSEFLGIIGYYMRTHETPREGLYWNSEFDGKIFESVVFGSHYKDPYYSQIDVTPYKSLDPFGNETSYRPLRTKDSLRFIGMEGSEPHMMTLLLKYLESVYDEADYKNVLGNILEYAHELSELNLFNGNLDPQSTLQNTRLFDYDFFKPMTIASSSHEVENVLTSDAYRGENGNFLYVVKDEDNNLLMGHRKEDNGFLPKFYFSPEDAQQLSKSLLYSSAVGQTLTPFQELVDHITYRSSEDFLTLKKSFEKYFTD